MQEDTEGPDTQKVAAKKPPYRPEVLVVDMPVADSPSEIGDDNHVFTTDPVVDTPVADSPSEIEEQLPVSLSEAETALPLPDSEAVVDEQLPGSLPNVEIPLPASLPATAYPVRVPEKQVVKAQSRTRLERDAANAQMVQARCRQLCLSLFFREHAPVRSLGFTSSLRGEGKSFLAMISADMLAKDSSEPVTLLECNWEHPCLHEHFGFSATPGLAEWLRGECSEMDIRHKVDHNLTVIPAGNGRGDAVKLLQQLRQKGLLEVCGRTKDLLVVDLPSIVLSAYGSLAASLVDSIIVVVRAGVTPDTMISEACGQLKDLPVHGVLLNQVKSRIPRWVRQML